MGDKMLRTICITACLMLGMIQMQAQNGAYNTGVYRNLFKEFLNKTDAEISTKVNAAFQQIFYGTSNQQLYYPVGTDMAYILDVNNNDVRTEGMSYGMMICVQLDKKAEFDKIWKWAKTYMQYGSSSSYNGYFAWQCNTNGTIKGNGPASDGEAYFITSLFFAANRWGNGTGIFNYEAEAQDILNKVMSKTGAGSVYNLFNSSSKLITFVPYGDSYNFTDPSYNLPGFWELWASWSKTNQSFWAQTPDASRTLLKNASNTTSGLSTDYSNFDGTPKEVSYNTDADRFMYDAWRTAMNIGVDYHWFQKDAWQPTGITKLLTFFKNKGTSYVNHYDWNGGNAGGDHSTGLVACNAAACLAITDNTLATPFVQELWNIAIPTGTYRYYDGMLYMLGLLNCSGNFKIWKPAPTGAPTVSITAPTSGTSLTTPTDVTITATAADANGSIANVEFYNGTQKLGEDATAPYSFTWTGVPAGTYNITAVATDNDGNKTTSSAIVLTVVAPPLIGKIIVRAKGVVGDEIINLEIGGTVVKTWTIGTTYADYEASGNVNGVIRVNYTNDDGDKRDAQIDYIIVADSTYQAEDQTFNTGYYANGSCGGGSNSEMMHCSGYIEFATAKVTDDCPNDPNKTSPGSCGCGVVDTDTDKDGIADCDDTDDDGDGVADVNDCDPLDATILSKTTYYADSDGDGKGDPNSSIQSCSLPTNYVTDNTDQCPNDVNKTVPGICGCGVVEGTCQQIEINLKAGWNLIGCPIDGSTAVETALSTIWSNVTIIKNLDTFYSSSNPAALNSLKTVEWGKGYMVKVSAPCTLIWKSK